MKLWNGIFGVGTTILACAAAGCAADATGTEASRSSDDALVRACPPDEMPSCGFVGGRYVCKCVPIPPVTISQCGATITSPGTYVLGGDLTTAPGGVCVTIQNTNGVTLNGQGHKITSGPPGPGAGIPVLVKNAAGTTVENCRLQASVGYGASLLGFESSPNGTVTGNTFSSDPSSASVTPTVEVTDSDWINVSSNTFSVPYQQEHTSDASIANNSLTCTSNDCSAMIYAGHGTGNAITNNVIDGSTTFQAGRYAPGADDGVVILDESNDSVSGNTIKNTWDCGIETYGNVANSAFFTNTISNASEAGICGYHYTSFQNNTVHGNTVTSAPYLLWFKREEGLRPANYDGYGAPAETGVYFRNNVFDGNTIAQALPGYGAWISFFDGSRYLNYQGALLSAGETAPTPSQFFLTGNSFSNNDFGPHLAFFGEPMLAGAVIDGGGNLCQWSGYADYPLACGR
jgi:hypothetical protein